MSYIYELARTIETSFTDCGVFAYNANAVMEGAIKNVAFAIKEPNDRPWKRLQYYRSVYANINAVQKKHNDMWRDCEKLASGERTGSSVSGEKDSLVSPTTKTPSRKQSKVSNPLSADDVQDIDYDQYAHVFTAAERENFQNLHLRASAYTEARRVVKDARDEYDKAAKKQKDKADALKQVVDSKEAILNAVRASLRDTMNAVLPGMFEAFRARFLKAVNELRVCFKLSPEMVERLRGQPQSRKSAETDSAEPPPEQTAAAPLQGIEECSGEYAQPSPDAAAATTSPVLHGDEEVAPQLMSNTSKGDVWFRFFYFDRLKSSTEKLSLTLTLCLLHFIRLEKKYEYEYPVALKAKLHHMLDLLNGYSWEKHRQRFDSILRDMFHYRKNLEHLRWATEELHELDRKIEKHSGDFMKHKVNTYTQRRVEVQKDVDALTRTLFESGANEMLKFYDALLTVVIKSLNDLVHLLHGSAQPSF